MSLKRNAYLGTALPSGAHQTSDMLDCTSECRAKEHSLLVLSSAYLGNLKLLKHCATVCNNPVHICDALGRNALHIAASKGFLQLMLWLLAKKKVKVDVYDLESKWTALHRSCYYGSPGAGALLIKYGADLNILDYDGWSPLNILNADREVVKKSLGLAAINVYTWGRNPNDTLGHDRTRSHPEKLDLGLPPADRVIKVVLCKFHSVFLSAEGHVLTCGHGPGGRLGHNSEQSIVTPRLVRALEGLACIGVAAARDHTVILTKSGAVYSCGLNDAHQLGHGSNPANAPSNYLAPKLIRGLKSKHVISVGTGRYHTAMCTETELYTVGKNLGQLGYEKNYETQVAPRAVAGVKLDNDHIVNMSVSDSATAILTMKNHAFVCTNFIVKHIRFSFLDKTSCLQFEVCASLSDRDYLRKVETEPTKLLVLDSEHKLWVWEPTKRGSTPNLFTGFTKHNVSQFSLGKRLTIVTKEGEVYKGNGSVNKPLNLQRVSNIQNACAVFTDFKANNFAYIQDIFRSSFLPAVSQSTLTADLAFLLEESCLSDISIEVGGQVFHAHKFVLYSQMHDFTSQLLSSDSLLDPVYKLHKKCEDPDVFDVFLHYVYGSAIRFIPHASKGMDGLFDGLETTPDTSFISVDENDLTEEYDMFGVTSEHQEDWLEEDMPLKPTVQSTPRKKYHSALTEGHSEEQPTDSWSKPEKMLQLGERRAEIKALLVLATTFDLADLKKALEDVVPHLHQPRTLLRSPLKLRRQQAFSDLTLISKEGKGLPCHRCVLVARSEYFRSMLLMGWKESADGLTSLTMPVAYKVLKAVIDFIYTDEFPTAIKGVEAVEWVMAVLVMADQLLLTRLKEFCEYSLAKILNLRNAVEFLEFAEGYSALQLKKSCLQFICVNISSFLEARSLDNLDTSLLEGLSESYRNLFLQNSKRIIKFPDPSLELLPESYFRDDKLEDEMESGASESEDPGTPDVPDVPTHVTISPRAVPNLRKKRKRKTSQSDKRQSKSPPPLSSVGEPQARANPSPPNPASPDSIISPCSPLSALASDCSPRSPHCPLENSTQSGTSNFSPSSLSSSSPWINIEKKRKNSNQCTPKAKHNSISEDEVVPQFESAPMMMQQGDKCGHPGGLVTPRSAPGKAPGHMKTKGEMRTRLLNKFNSMTMEIDLLGQSQKGSGGNSSPVQTENIPKGPWSSLNTGVPNGSKNLRDIMAKEEELQQRNRQVKPRSPPPSVPHSVRSMPIPVRKPSLKEASFSSPGNNSSPASSNPWGTPEAAVPAVVSMRDLIAEAEAEDKENKKNASKKNKPKVTTKKVEEERLGRRQQPSVPPHQQVSFASIIKSQEESERNKNRLVPNKALSLILIEERAISELEKAYSAANNPDEYITVKRCSKEPLQQDYRGSVVRINSPWGKE